MQAWRIYTTGGIGPDSLCIEADKLQVIDGTLMFWRRGGELTHVVSLAHLVKAIKV